MGMRDMWSKKNNEVCKQTCEELKGLWCIDKFSWPMNPEKDSLLFCVFFIKTNFE